MNTEMREERIAKAEIAYAAFMDAIMPHDWRKDPNSAETPHRVAKMFVNELNNGLYGDAKPKITVFDNVDGYDGIVFEGDIVVKSMCSHHHMPFMGKAYVAYIPSPTGKIIGLSKLNRIVNDFARRPQVQENLTKQIHDEIARLMPENSGVAVMIAASHTCVSHRGIGQDSIMKTTKFSGMFFENKIGTRDEFMSYVAGSN